MENAIKHKANQAVANALREGILIRPEVCSSCGYRVPVEFVRQSLSQYKKYSRPDKLKVTLNEYCSRFIKAHHYDYSQPLEIVWLCVSCHVKVHRALHQILKEHDGK